MNPELEAAHRAGVSYLEPADLGDHRGRTMRMPELATLQESYAAQVYVQDGVLVRPYAAEVEAPDADSPGTRWIVTGWNARGAHRTAGQQRQANVRLNRHVLHAGGQVVANGVTLAADRRWFEDHLVVTGLPTAVVIRLGREAGQPAVVALADDALTIVPTSLRDDVEGVSLGVIVEPVPRTCPMRVDGVPGGVCARRGGPWISRSIHAAAIWGTHRAMLLARLPCIPCAGGTLPVLGYPGRARSFGGLLLPSRYGGWAWAR